MSIYTESEEVVYSRGVPSCSGGGVSSCRGGGVPNCRGGGMPKCRGSVGEYLMPGR